MSKIDYQALRAKAEKATCGEWSLEYGEGRFDGDDALIHREAAGYIPICRIEGAHPESGFDEDFQMEQQANAEFIAAANPATVLALLGELEAEAVMFCISGQNVDSEEHVSTSKAVVDAWVEEWNQVDGSPGEPLYKTMPLYYHAALPAPVVPEGLVKAVRFYEQVKNENPPAETGAWKDAVDWVLKEACQAVNIGIKGE
ncbi:TPA: ead/Ea22-like family protein [Escherichia coli]|uniref:ead/Ea22-like family protein n=1 Tax=Escherichia coli TaxID=562 RepID=UPI001D2CC5E3|nr:ead/Ea22-like family protein [Escherichia coli]